MITPKRPEKYTGIDAECEEGRIWNQTITEYDLWLTGLLKDVRENLGKYDEAPNPVHLCLTIEAIRVLIERVDNNEK